MLMKRLFCILAVLAMYQSSQAQNLVLNSGFESYVTCPSFGQFGTTWINNWSKPSIASSDYYNSMCPGIVPTQQSPLGGNAYAGIIAYNYGSEYREYITGSFSSPLIVGKTYYVEFHVSLHDGYVNAIHQLGAYFSNTAPGPFSSVLHINVTPQIQNSSGLLSNNSGWTAVNGTFVADGGEQFITIGNFNNDSNTTVVQVGNIGNLGSYYFIDSVSVLPEPEGVSQIQEPHLLLSPNPAKDFFVLRVAHAETLFIYDMLGKTRHYQKLEKKSMAQRIDISALSAGVYLVVTFDGQKKVIQKLLVE